MKKLGIIAIIMFAMKAYAGIEGTWENSSCEYWDDNLYTGRFTYRFYSDKFETFIQKYASSPCTGEKTDTVPLASGSYEIKDGNPASLTVHPTHLPYPIIYKITLNENSRTMDLCRNDRCISYRQRD